MVHIDGNSLVHNGGNSLVHNGGNSTLIAFSIGLIGCLKQSDQETPKVSEPTPLSVVHDANQCPDLSGTYTKEYTDSSTGEKETITMNVLLSSDKGYLEFSIDKDKRYVVDGTSQQGTGGLSALEYQAGCVNNTLVIQGSILSVPITERRYSLENGSLFMRSKSLDEKVLKFEDSEVTWYRQQNAPAKADTCPKPSVVSQKSIQTELPSLNGIYGGVTAKSTSPLLKGVVGVVTWNGSTIDSTCTGSLLPGNIVLTAAHCVKNVDIKKLVITFTDDMESISKNFHSVVMAVIHPKFSEGGGNEEDLALLKFSGPVPEGYEPYDFPDECFKTTESTDLLVMAGFGSTLMNSLDSGILRFTILPTSQMREGGKLPKLLWVEQNETGVCPGDSGSGLTVLRNKKLYLIGVLSGHLSFERNKQTCSGAVLYANLAKNLDWLRPAYENLRKK